MDQIPIEVLTPAGMILLAVWMIYTGRLIPGRTHDEICAGLRQDRDDWQQIAQTSSRQVDALLNEYGPTATQVLKALPRARDTE